MFMVRWGYSELLEWALWGCSSETREKPATEIITLCEEGVASAVSEIQAGSSKACGFVSIAKGPECASCVLSQLQ